ncbi:MAG: NAD(P)-dependent oxidoreductase [Bacteroidota bacterium]|jgi:D-phosphoglycerate dehydrogenase|nr:D-phosphoglycerate dehydrogenase [Bacteroidetes oral taxon 274 str. F0058]
MKILVATEKPFAKKATDEMRNIAQSAGVELVLLEKYTDVNDFYRAVETVDGLIVRSDKVTKEVVAHAKNLKIVVRAGAGFDNLDLAACTERKIVCMNTPGQNSNAVAELAIGMMIFMARNTFAGGTGSELKGKTLGIHAYGNVGRLVGLLGKAFGMNVIAFDPFVKRENVEKDGVGYVETIEDLYKKANYISLHIPANDKTKKSINYALLSLMPQGAFLINTARKEVVNEEDLVKLMAEREDFKYATDIAPENLAELKEKFGNRVFATPKKMGAETSEANINAGLAAIRQAIGFLKDGIDKFRVN